MTAAIATLLAHASATLTGDIAKRIHLLRAMQRCMKTSHPEYRRVSAHLALLEAAEQINAGAQLTFQLKKTK